MGKVPKADGVRFEELEHITKIEVFNGKLKMEN
jgi:hypothetical protein